MKTTFKLAIYTVITVFCLSINSALAQFNFVQGTNPPNVYGRTSISGNIRGIGIGNFTNTNLPSSALHVNTNLFPVGFQTGEVFRTTSNATGNNVNAWRLYTGAGYGTEKFSLLVPANTNNVVLQATQQNGVMFFNTFNSNKVRINGNFTANINGVTQIVTGYVGISPTGYFTNQTPWSMLHLEGGNNTTFPGHGWRRWMNTGVFLKENSDAMYVGLKQEAGVNRSDAIINWSDDEGLDNLRILFTGVASTGNGDNTNLDDPISLNGREIARFTPVGNVGIGPLFTASTPPRRRLDIQDNGNVPQLRLTYELGNTINLGRYTDFRTTHLGDLAIMPYNTTLSNANFHPRNVGINVISPARRLDVLDDGMGSYGGRPQMRLTANQSQTTYTDFQTCGGGTSPMPAGVLTINPRNVNDIKYVAINYENAATQVFAGLSLDVNGQVNIRTVNTTTAQYDVLVWSPSDGRVMRKSITPGGLLGNPCPSSPQNLLPSDWEIPLNKHNFVFSGNNQGIPVNNVGIGISSCTPKAKLDILQRSNALGSIGLLVENQDFPDPNNNRAVIGIQSIVSSANTPTLSSRFQIAGWFQCAPMPPWYSVTFSQYAIFVPRRGGMVSIGFDYLANNPTPLFNENVNFAVAGTVLNAGPNWVSLGITPSDTLLKENIIPFNSGIEILRQIDPISYTYNGKAYFTEGLNNIGVIANDLTDFAPYALDTIPLQLNPTDTFFTDILGVKTDAMLYTVVNAVKDIDSAVTILQQTVPPPKPVLVSPANNDLNVPLVSTFTWDPAERATSYTLYIDISGGIMALNTTDTFAVVTLPRSCQDYKWWVTAYNEAGSSDISDSWSFGTYSLSPPAIPVLVSPPDSSEDLPLTNTFTWYRTENADKYCVTIFFDNYPKGSPVLFYVTETRDTSIIVNLPEYGRKYLWSITASGCNNNAYSETWHLRTAEPQIPSVPVLIFPRKIMIHSAAIFLFTFHGTAPKTRNYTICTFRQHPIKTVWYSTQQHPILFIQYTARIPD